MCKLAIIPTIPEDKESNAYKLLIALKAPMSDHDNDGLGIMGIGDKGLFVDRWLDNDNAFTTGELSGEMNKYADVLSPIVSDHNCYGTKTKRVYSLAMHTRMATSEYGMHNVHPFLNSECTTALIHNGVISNAHEYTLTQSTCDSEAILIEYDRHGVNKSLGNLQSAISGLQGYYAACVYSVDSSGAWVVDVFKDATAQLYCGYVSEINGVVFTTSADHLQEACESIGFHVSNITRVKDNTGFRVNPKTGEILEKVSISPTPRAQNHGLSIVSSGLSEYDYSGRSVDWRDDIPSYREDALTSEIDEERVDDLVDIYSENFRRRSR